MKREIIALMMAASFVLFFSLRVYWKGYRPFTAMNISLLPYVIYYEMIYWGIYLDIEFLNDFFGYKGTLFKVFGDFWGKIIQFLILGTPLLVIWAFIPIKAMFMRLVAQPEG